MVGGVRLDETHGYGGQGGIWGGSGSASGLVITPTHEVCVILKVSGRVSTHLQHVRLGSIVCLWRSRLGKGSRPLSLLAQRIYL